MIVYVDHCNGVGPRDLDGFFVGWPTPPTPEAHLRVLQRSDAVVLAVDDGKIVGFVNAITDGVLSAYVPLVEVLPSHQGRGIGTELMRRLLARVDQCYMIDTSCDENLVPFYERLGMDRSVAMIKRGRIHGAQGGAARQRGAHPPVALFLDGPSGAGKTTVARLLQDVLADTWLFYEVDRCEPRVPRSRPDLAGLAAEEAMRRGNLSAARAYVDAGFRLIVEMALPDEPARPARRERDAIFGDIETADVLLTCTRATIEERTVARGDRDLAWALRYFDNGDWAADSADLTVPTDGRSPSEVTAELAHWIAQWTSRFEEA